MSLLEIFDDNTGESADIDLSVIVEQHFLHSYPNEDQSVFMKRVERAMVHCGMDDDNPAFNSIQTGVMLRGYLSVQ